MSLLEHILDGRHAMVREFIKEEIGADDKFRCDH